jgi:natural resistance-associated macrophage protein
LQVIGTAIALLLLSRGAVPLWAGVLAAAAAAYTLLFLERLGVRWLEIAFEVLIAGECGSAARTMGVQQPCTVVGLSRRA